jgi:ribosomal protein S18 acetylase RimI-like enzyme
MPIRHAEPADAKGIGEVHVAAWRAAYRGLLPDDTLDRLSVEASARRWEERIAAPWGHVLVAVQEDRVVGFAAGGNTQDEDVDPARVGEIYVLYIHPQVWRRGWGTALLDELMQHLRGDGFEEVILWVLEGNEHAIPFYRAAGFEADGASRVKRRPDGTHMPLVRYRRGVNEA